MPAPRGRPTEDDQTKKEVRETLVVSSEEDKKVSKAQCEVRTRDLSRTLM